MADGCFRARAVSGGRETLFKTATLSDAACWGIFSSESGLCQWEFDWVLRKSEEVKDFRWLVARIRCSMYSSQHMVPDSQNLESRGAVADLQKRARSRICKNRMTHSRCTLDCLLAGAPLDWLLATHGPRFANREVKTAKIGR